MSYNPTAWVDRVVDRPRTYNVQNNADGTITLVPAPGTIHEPGTPVNAVNMNKIEQGIAAAARPDVANRFTNTQIFDRNSDINYDAMRFERNGVMVGKWRVFATSIRLQGPDSTDILRINTDGGNVAIETNLSVSGNASVSNATSGSHAINRDFGDSRYALKGAANTFTQAQTFQSNREQVNAQTNNNSDAGITGVVHRNASGTKVWSAGWQPSTDKYRIYNELLGRAPFEIDGDLVRVRGLETTFDKVRVSATADARARVEIERNGDVWAFQHHSSGQLGILRNDSTLIRVSNSGNLGLGELTPTEKLHVAGNGRFSGWVRVNGQTNSNYYVRNAADGNTELPPSGMLEGDVYYEWE